MGMNTLEARRRVIAAQPHKESQSGAVVSFSTYVPQALPMTVDIDPVQAGTGDPSPENIRPISGWTGCNVTQVGTNDIPNGTDTSNGYVSGKFLKSNGTTGNDSNSFVSEYFIVNANETYMMYSEKSVLNNASVCFYDANKTYISGEAYAQTRKNITAPSNAVYARATQCFSASYDYAHFEIGDVYSITFPSSAGTVYGGTLTVNKDGTGTLTRTHRIYIFDGVNTRFTSTSSNTTWNEYYFSTSTLSKYGQGNATSVSPENLALYGFFSNYGVNGSGLSLRPRIYIGETGNTQPRVIFNHEDGINTLAKCNNKLKELYDNGYPLQYYIALRNPVKYDLTELQVVETLKGENNVFADTGSVEVEYWTN
jgi:hypothetical protein